MNNNFFLTYYNNYIIIDKGKVYQQINKESLLGYLTKNFENHLQIGY